MAARAQATDYTDRNFDSLRLRLQNLVRSVFLEWTDFNVANFRNLLLALHAFLGDVLTFYQDHQARESRIAMVTQRKNLIALTNLLGFRPAGARAATADVTFTLAAPPAAAVPAARRGSAKTLRTRPRTGHDSRRRVRDTAAPRAHGFAWATRSQPEARTQVTGNANRELNRMAPAQSPADGRTQSGGAVRPESPGHQGRPLRGRPRRPDRR